MPKNPFEEEMAQMAKGGGRVKADHPAWDYQMPEMPDYKTTSIPDKVMPDTL